MFPKGIKRVLINEYCHLLSIATIIIIIIMSKSLGFSFVILPLSFAAAVVVAGDTAAVTHLY